MTDQTRELREVRLAVGQVCWLYPVAGAAVRVRDTGAALELEVGSRLTGRVRVLRIGRDGAVTQEDDDAATP